MEGILALLTKIFGPDFFIQAIQYGLILSTGITLIYYAAIIIFKPRGSVCYLHRRVEDLENQVTEKKMAVAELVGLKAALMDEFELLNRIGDKPVDKPPA